MVAVVHPAGSGLAGACTAWAVRVTVAVAPAYGFPTDLGNRGVTVNVTAELVLVKVRFGVLPLYEAARSLDAVQQVKPNGQVPPVVPAPVGTAKELWPSVVESVRPETLVPSYRGFPPLPAFAWIAMVSDTNAEREPV
jgi:hypothetical protein